MHHNWWRWWTLLTTVALAPLVWWALFQDKSVIASYDDITYTIGMVSGLISYTMFWLTFVLAGRFRRVESLFGWLDKMYIVHAIVWSSAFVFMLLHPIFLVLQYLPEDIYLAASYLLPGSHRSINRWIAWFLGVIALMIITLYIKRMKYHHWKYSHTLFSVTFLFICLHVFLINTDLATIYFPWYYTYSTLVTIMGLWSYAYTILGRRKNTNKVYQYEIAAVHDHENATEIALRPLGKHMSYKAWQFAFLKFENTRVSAEPHPFSFASSNHPDHLVRIIMKHLGDFTETTTKLCLWDRVLLEWPYGKFTLNTTSSLKKIWIAWWIGITPFMAMADELIKHPTMEVDLYYLVRNQNDLIWLSYFQEIEKQLRSFHLIPRVSSKQGRLDIKQLHAISGDPLACEYYVCGPVEMKTTFITILQSLWIPARRIYSEWYSFKI